MQGRTGHGPRGGSPVVHREDVTATSSHEHQLTRQQLVTDAARTRCRGARGGLSRPRGRLCPAPGSPVSLSSARGALQTLTLYWHTTNTSRNPRNRNSKDNTVWPQCSKSVAKRKERHSLRKCKKRDPLCLTTEFQDEHIKQDVSGSKGYTAEAGLRGTLVA